MSKIAAAGLDLNSPPKSISCETCSISKNNKLACNGKLIKNEKRHVVHMDTCGPFCPPTFSKSTYFISFIVEHSRYAKVSLIRLKSDALRKFQEFVARLERDSGVQV